MSNKKVLLLCLAIGLLVVFALVADLVKLFSDTGFSEDNVRAYARKFIETHPGWILKSDEAVIQDVKMLRCLKNPDQTSAGDPSGRISIAI